MLNNITLCEYIAFYVFSRQMLGIWIVSAFWVLWIMLLWTFVFKFLCGHVFISLGNMARSRIDGLNVLTFTVPGDTDLHCYRLCFRVLLPQALSNWQIIYVNLAWTTSKKNPKPNTSITVHSYLSSSFFQYSRNFRNLK